MSDTENESLNFENSLEKLEEIVNKMESGNLPLEQALDYYEQGVNLTKRCQDALKTAELKIQKITNSVTDISQPPTAQKSE